MSIKPPDRRPRQRLSEPAATELVTHTLDRTQRWRQYGWIDQHGYMYDLSENPADYQVPSYSPLWVLVDNEHPALPEQEVARDG